MRKRENDKQLTEITIKVSRVPAVVFGIIGVAVSVVLFLALAAYSYQIFRSIVDAGADYGTLLIVATALVVAALAFIFLTILIISSVSIWGRFNKGLRVVLFTFVVLAIVLLLSAAVLGAIWLGLPR
jgi:hypothetical protein